MKEGNQHYLAFPYEKHVAYDMVKAQVLVDIHFVEAPEQEEELEEEEKTSFHLKSNVHII